MPGVVSERKKQSIRNRVLWSRDIEGVRLVAGCSQLSSKDLNEG